MKRIKRFFRETSELVFIGGLFLFLFMLITILIWGVSKKEDAEWEVFRETHHCKLVAKVSGSPTGNGYILPKDGWLCDDGITYYRDNL
jgi:hypothetical protein